MKREGEVREGCSLPEENDGATAGVRIIKRNVFQTGSECDQIA